PSTSAAGGGRHLAEQEQDDRPREAGGRDERRESADDRVGERPGIPTADARAPGRPRADPGDPREHDAEYDGSRGEERDLARVTHRDRVRQVGQRADEGDRDEHAGHGDRDGPETGRFVLSLPALLFWRGRLTATVGHQAEPSRAATMD